MVPDDSANRIQASPDILVKEIKLAPFKYSFKQSFKRKIMLYYEDTAQYLKESSAIAKPGLGYTIYYKIHASLLLLTTISKKSDTLGVNPEQVIFKIIKCTQIYLNYSIYYPCCSSLQLIELFCPLPVTTVAY